MERTTTKIRGGAIAGWPLEIEITGIICINMMTKKYRFANFFVNYSNKLYGTNVMIEYFDVRTVLLRTFLLLRMLASASSFRSIERIPYDAALFDSALPKSGCAI